MGLHPPRRTAGTGKRVALVGLLGLGALLLGGCDTQSNSFERLAMPDPASAQGEYTLHLWQGAWIAALITGFIVWGLIAYVVIRFRRRSPDEVPVQTRYNLPLEIFYTIAPIIMVIVLFDHVVKTQDIILDDHQAYGNTVEVVGQQWSWSFNYGVGTMNAAANAGPSDHTYPYSDYVTTVRTASVPPTLWLPVNVNTRFNLWSPDVIHDFGVPSFLMKMDVIPGRVNHYYIKPTRIGNYRGACYELCGQYHSRMIFRVNVVSVADYNAHIAQMVAAKKQAGDTSTNPLLGGADAYTEAGLDTASGDSQ